MIKIEQVKEALRVALAEHAGAVALYFSGGSDSLLLLHMMLDMKQPFSIICFDHMMTKVQRRYIDSIIQAHDLRVFSYRPSNAYLVGDGERVSFVEEYAMLGAGLMPFIKDVAHDETRCAVTDVEVKAWHEGHAPVGFKLNIFGTRKSDRHYATGKAWPQGPEWAVGPFHYLAPLWDWTRKDVKAALKEYGAAWPKLDTGTLPMCLTCLCPKTTGQVLCPKIQDWIDPIDWDPNAMLKEFREKHRLLPKEKTHDNQSET